MSWIRSSKSVALVVLLLASVAVVGPAAALSVSAEDVPSEASVGDEVTVTVVIDDPFTDEPSSWTLAGETELESVSWTVTILDQGNQIGDDYLSGNQTFERALDSANDGDKVQIELTGTVPTVEDYTYESEEQFTLFRLNQVTGNNEELLRENETHHYTDQSREARQTIDDAQAAINDSGGNAEAEDQLDRAIETYNQGNFNTSIDLAEDAKQKAEGAQQSQQLMQLVLLGGGGLVVLLLIGGGIYVWQSGGDDYDKLQ